MAVTPLRFTQPTTGPAWHALCQTTKSGPLPNLFNALVALRNDPHWASKFRHNDMLRTVVAPDTPLKDIEVERIHEWLQEHGLKRVGLDTVREAIDIVGHEHPFHPLRDWLSGLVWDGNLRLSGWLASYLGAPDSEANKAFSAMFLISMVARIFRPGCQADHMLVLEGAQGILKSQVCRTLGSPYFSDALPDLGSDYVRVCMHLRGKWLIEVPELSAFNKAEATRLKAFLTQPEEQYTPKFGRNEVTEPRQCVFIGTTNDNHYLRDATGGRRFWPVKCGVIDLDSLRRDRNQLFAEAVDAYRRDVQWWPDPDFQENVIAPLQDARYEADVWEEPVRKHLLGKSETTLHDVAFMGLGLPNSTLGTATTRRLTAILRNAGWKERHTKTKRDWISPNVQNP